METLHTLAIALLVPASILACAAAVLRFARVTAQPDEWLLRIRNGKVLDAGVGISLWRRPDDVVARFSSALQRVRFTVAATSAEHLPLKIEGFILWSLAADVERVFRAFSKLGIANLDRPPPGLKSRSHLLTSSQHRAFQALLAAEVRAHAGGLGFGELLVDEQKLRGGLERRLAALAEQLGIVVERTEILLVEPADAGLGRELAARSEERVREEAAAVRLRAAARLRKLEAEHALSRAAEEQELQLAQADGERRIAESERDTALVKNFAEEQKSQALRDHELARFAIEKTAAAMASWQIREGKWIQTGTASPVAAVASALLAVREVVAESAPAVVEKTRGAA